MINASEIQVGASAMATDINFMTTHLASPDGTGSNRTTGSAVAVTPTSASGVITIGSTSFTGIAANGTVTYIGFWHGDPASSGVFRGYLALAGPNLAANAAGQFVIDSVTITGMGN